MARKSSPKKEVKGTTKKAVTKAKKQRAMKMKKRCFGFLGPQAYMKGALAELKRQYNIYSLNPKSCDAKEIARVVADCKKKGIEAVGGFAQKDALHHILINAGLGNVAPSRLSMLYGMNKYLMRTLEKDPFFYAPVDPLTESDEQIKAKIPSSEWPFMLKHTSLSLGRGIYKIDNFKKLKLALQSYREDTKLQELTAKQNATILEGVDPSTVPKFVPPFLAEHLQSGNVIEYCYEGYITPQGQVVHYAFTEELYFADHQGLGYVTPPVSVDASSASRIEKYAEQYMSGWAKIGYLNQFFNLEFWLLPDGSIKLTEMNPRAAHSYHYNYALCCGASLFGDNFLLAAGSSPASPTPFQRWKRGDNMKFTMIVLFTLKRTGKISDMIDYSYVRQLETKERLLVRHTRGKDETIAASELTAAGVMVMQIWITADTKQQLITKEREMRAKIYKGQQQFQYPENWK